MKLFIFLIFIINTAFANYSFNEENSKKIDMHGGKPTELIDKKNKFDTKKLDSLSDFSIKKPKKPKEPKKLIKKEKNNGKNL
ncbi:MAG: hypothetical protein ACQERD_09945 [Campylobacterota bacterium]